MTNASLKMLMIQKMALREEIALAIVVTHERYTHSREGRIRLEKSPK